MADNEQNLDALAEALKTAVAVEGGEISASESRTTTRKPEPGAPDVQSPEPEAVRQIGIVHSEEEIAGLFEGLFSIVNMLEPAFPPLSEDEAAILGESFKPLFDKYASSLLIMYGPEMLAAMGLARIVGPRVVAMKRAKDAAEAEQETLPLRGTVQSEQ